MQMRAVCRRWVSEVLCLAMKTLRRVEKSENVLYALHAVTMERVV